MPGRHASPDPSRFRQDLARLIVLTTAIALVGVAAVQAIRFLAGPDDEPGSVAGTSTTTSVSPSTSTATTAGTTAPPVTLPPVREPGLVPVLVLNSTRVPGLAGRLTGRLADLGYQTLQPDNYPALLEVTAIRYVEGFESEAEVLAGLIPDAHLEAFPGDDPEAALTVVIGASYRE